MDYLHKNSSQISKHHALVVLENLKIRNMSKSASGTVEAPGANVKAKSGLNKSIQDQGWYEFRRQLTYKLEWNGGRVILISPQYTSQRCSSCKRYNVANRYSQSGFKCVECGFTTNADHNAALNILAAGIIADRDSTVGHTGREALETA